MLILCEDILKIQNLECFSSLTKLQLDNNCIEKIGGLSTLVKLTWLGEPRAPAAQRILRQTPPHCQFVHALEVLLRHRAELAHDYCASQTYPTITLRGSRGLTSWLTLQT